MLQWAKKLIALVVRKSAVEKIGIHKTKRKNIICARCSRGAVKRQQSSLLQWAKRLIALVVRKNAVEKIGPL